MEEFIKTEMDFWAILGNRGCREKKTPNCHKYATFSGAFSLFSSQKVISKIYSSIRSEKLHNIKLRKI
jgi:hypothetical protein